MRAHLATLALAVACASPAFASPPPPDGSKPLSDILAQVEQRPDFRYIDEAEFEHGSYKVEYYTKDGVKHKIYIDPATGKQQ
ncbi:MAG: PepSY domain-containing protein [Stellaceae bacterium]